MARVNSDLEREIRLAGQRMFSSVYEAVASGDPNIVAAKSEEFGSELVAVVKAALGEVEPIRHRRMRG